MKTTLLLKERHVANAQAFAELIVWQASSPVHGSAHAFKYCLAYIADGICVLRYANEPGKGDYRDLGNQETPYSFSTPTQLISDFWTDIDNWSPT